MSNDAYRKLCHTLGDQYNKHFGHRPWSQFQFLCDGERWPALAGAERRDIVFQTARCIDVARYGRNRGQDDV